MVHFCLVSPPPPPPLHKILVTGLLSYRGTMSWCGHSVRRVSSSCSLSWKLAFKKENPARELPTWLLQCEQTRLDWSSVCEKQKILCSFRERDNCPVPLTCTKHPHVLQYPDVPICFGFGPLLAGFFGVEAEKQSKKGLRRHMLQQTRDHECHSCCCLTVKYLAN